jgi:hypothetical protein
MPDGEIDLGDRAQTVNDKYGGIDLTPANLNLQMRNTQGGIKFHMDPAMIQKLQNAPGFIPVIINIQPISDLRRFLGMQESAS